MSYPENKKFVLRLLIHLSGLFLVVICFACGQKEQEPFAGTWAYMEQDIDLYPNTGEYKPSKPAKKQPLFKQLHIHKIGKHHVQYHVVTGRQSFVFRMLKDTSLYTLSGSGDTTLLIYNIHDQTLQFSDKKHNFMGVREIYFPVYHRTSYESVDQKHADKDNFFDFDISHYQSGNINNFVPHERILPFRVSSSFIKERHIRELAVPLQFIKPTAGSYDTTRFTCKLEFNANGLVTKVIGAFETREEEQWNFFRRNDTYSSLEKIEYRFLAQTPEYSFYDADEWPVDKYDQKIADDQVEWELLDGYYPSRYTLSQHHAHAEFQYDKALLTAMTLFEGDEMKGEIFFQYNQDGVLSNIRWLSK